MNEKGDPIRLRGLGLGNWLLPEGYMWNFGNQADRPRRIEKLVEDLLGPAEAKRFWQEYRANYIADADLERMAALGFNSVRPAINSRVLLLAQADPPVYSEEGFALLDHLIAQSKARGIYVILDMHAAPGGQTGQNIDDSEEDEPELFMDAACQDQLVALWTTIARRYKDEPAVAGYDLLNEPLPARTGAARAFKANLEPLYQRITKAIRSVDTRHMIILEGADWANDWSVFSAPFDNNLVYQFHYYCWDHPAALKSIQKYLDYRARFNAPVWVGETGERDNAIYWATTRVLRGQQCWLGVLALEEDGHAQHPLFHQPARPVAGGEELLARRRQALCQRGARGLRGTARQYPPHELRLLPRRRECDAAPGPGSHRSRELRARGAQQVLLRQRYHPPGKSLPHLGAGDDHVLRQ